MSDVTTAAYEQRAETFSQALMREYYLVGAGHKEQLEVSAIYDSYSDLFTPETVKTVLAQKGSKAGRRLAWFAVDGYISNQTKALAENITNAELSAIIEWDGDQVSYRNIRQRMANEPDWQRRHELESRMYDIAEELNPSRAEALRREHDLADQLGFDSYTGMVEELKELDLSELAAQMRTLLAETEDRYVALLDAHVAALDMPREDVSTADLTYLSRAPQFDDLFPADALLPTLERTLQGMQLPLSGDNAPELDVEARPRKSPRAFCAPVSVPEEVYLVIKPVGGQDDYQSLFHEAGHAEHFSWVDPDLPFAYRYLGDDAVSETYAFLFEHLTHNSHWLTGTLDTGTDRADEYRRFALFLKLWFLRRYAAKLLYELEHLHAGDMDAADAYERLLYDALKVKIDRRRYLEDVDSAYYVAGYLRAWIFEMQLRERLVDQHGQAWWKSPDAGTMLKALWRIGIRDSVNELANRLGYDGLNIRPLLDEFLDSP